MTLIVETGEIVTGADSYVSLQGYTDYAVNRGWALASSAVAQEEHIRRAFDTINRLWSFAGDCLSADQSGAWPRSIASGIPKAIVNAQCELAYLIQGGLDPFATITQSTTKKKIGPIEVESQPTGKPRLVAVEGLLRPFLSAGVGQVQMVRG